MEDYKELVEFLDKKFEKIDGRFDKIEEDAKEFRNDMLSFKDHALKDLEDLKQEKTFGDAQDKRKTKVLEIHNNALTSKKILSDSEVGKIEKLHAF